jgi:translation initiation factor 2 subunit 1
LSEKSTVAERVLPEVGELVVATVSRIADYGAYVTLDEYDGIDGLLHISEVSSSWVKNIRDYVREREKVVLKVLRVDPEKKQIDLSLRRVSGKEKQVKLLEFKKRRKAEFILGVAAEKLGVNQETFISEVASKIEEKFGSVYAGLEEMIEKGEDLSTRLGISEEWIETVATIAQQKIKVPKVMIKGMLQLTCFEPDGVDRIKEVLTKCKTLRRPRKVKVDVYSLGSPRYAVEVTARNYKDAEKTMKELSEFAQVEMRRLGCQGEFRR